MRSPFIEAILAGRQPSAQDFLTPGINGGAKDYRQDLTELMLQQKQQKPQGAFGKVDNFLGTPGGGFLMNLLAQSGYSTMPHSPLGAIGKAALMSNQQGQQRDQNDLQRRLIESQIGLYDAKAGVEGQVGGGKPLTELAKLAEDFQTGRISAEGYEAARQKIVREGTDNEFDQTQALRGEFRRDTDGIRTSQSALAAAKALVAQGNPIAATAAFTSFIRSIDNSVVRPAEQAAYSSAGGLARRLEDEISKLKGQGPIGENTRRDLLTSIETLEKQLSGILDRTVSFYNEEADLSKLRPNSITGIPSPESPSVEIPTSPVSALEPELLTPEEVSALKEDVARLRAEIAAGGK